MVVLSFEIINLTVFFFYRYNRHLECIKVSAYLCEITEKFLERNPNVQVLHCVSEVPSIISFMITENQLTNLKSLKLERLVISNFLFDNFKNLTDFSFNHGLLSGHCAASIFQIKSLQIVTLKRNNMFDSIPFKQTIQLNRLVYLDVSHNNFTSNCNLFNYILNLSILNLSSNLLRVITHNMFSGFKNLTILNLSNNIINEIEKNVFENLICLEVINLDSNIIVEFRYEHFRTMTRLRRLHLVSNVLQVLEYVPIKSYDCLVEVFDIADNLIEAIDCFFFWPMTNLTYLNLNMNSIEHLCRCHFRTLTLLRYLDLSANLISTINQDLFHDLKSLQSLKMSDNFIGELNGDVFMNLIDLCVLDLSFNKIETIPDRIFQSNRKLKHLLLYNNQLKMLAEDIFSYACFDCVDLTNNYIDYRSEGAFFRIFSIGSCFVVDSEIGAILNIDSNKMYKIVIGS